MTWSKLLDFFEPHSPYLKIGIIIVFLAQSQHLIKVSYFYCLLGKKSNAKSKSLSSLALTVCCCCCLSAFLCYISWIRESWLAQSSFHVRPAYVAKLVNAPSLFHLSHQQHLTQLMILSCLKHFSQWALRMPHLLDSSRFSLWLPILSLCHWGPQTLQDLNTGAFQGLLPGLLLTLTHWVSSSRLMAFNLIESLKTSKCLSSAHILP